MSEGGRSQGGVKKEGSRRERKMEVWKPNQISPEEVSVCVCVFCCFSEPFEVKLLNCALRECER